MTPNSPNLNLWDKAQSVCFNCTGVCLKCLFQPYKCLFHLFNILASTFSLFKMLFSLSQCEDLPRQMLCWWWFPLWSTNFLADRPQQTVVFLYQLLEGWHKLSRSLYALQTCDTKKLSNFLYCLAQYTFCWIHL